MVPLKALKVDDRKAIKGTVGGWYKDTNRDIESETKTKGEREKDQGKNNRTEGEERG